MGDMGEQAPLLGEKTSAPMRMVPRHAQPNVIADLPQRFQSHTTRAMDIHFLRQSPIEGTKLRIRRTQWAHSVER